MAIRASGSAADLDAGKTAGWGADMAAMMAVESGAEWEPGWAATVVCRYASHAACNQSGLELELGLVATAPSPAASAHLSQVWSEGPGH